MSSPPRSKREEERRLNLRTLVIASIASATAALVTSRLWIAGTWIAAAMTPVIVALVSELLHRPTDVITRGLTSDSPALPDPEAPARRVAERMRTAEPDALVPDPDAPAPGPEAPPAGEAPPGREAPPPRGARPASGAPTPREAPVRIYRTEPARPPASRRRRIAYRAVLVTAGLAFAIAAIGLTVTELVAGNSLGKSDRRTTLIPAKRHKSDTREPANATPAHTDTTQQQTETVTTTRTQTETSTTSTAPAPSGGQPPGTDTTSTTP